MVKDWLTRRGRWRLTDGRTLKMMSSDPLWPFDPAPKVARPLVSSGLLRFKKDATYITQVGLRAMPRARRQPFRQPKIFTLASWKDCERGFPTRTRVNGREGFAVMEQKSTLGVFECH